MAGATVLKTDPLTGTVSLSQQIGKPGFVAVPVGALSITKAGTISLGSTTYLKLAVGPSTLLPTSPIDTDSISLNVATGISLLTVKAISNIAAISFGVIAPKINFTGATTVTGTTSIVGNTDVTGITSIIGNTYVEGETNLIGTLTVSGVTTLPPPLPLTGPSGTLIVGTIPAFSGTFTTNDVPAKVVTVTNGIITSIT